MASNSITADTSGLQAVGRQLRSAATPMYNGARAAARIQAERMVEAGKQESGWSHRIPSTIKQSRYGAIGFKISAGGASAPHAPAYEHLGLKGTFKHPLNYPNQRAAANPPTVTENSRPFLRPAVAIHLREMQMAIRAAIIKALKDRIVAAHEESKH